MENYFDGYKEKALELFSLCLEAKEKGEDFLFSYSANLEGVSLIDWKQNGIAGTFNSYFDFSDGLEKINEMIAYVKKQIEGDNDVRT